MKLFGKKHKITLLVEGMTCKHCVLRVEKALRSVPEVNKVKVDLKNNRAEVTLENNDPSIEKSLVSAVQTSGYRASISRSGNKRNP